MRSRAQRSRLLRLTCLHPLLWLLAHPAGAAPAGGSCAFVGVTGNEILVRDAGGEVRSLGRITRPVRAAAWSPDGAFVAHAFFDQEERAEEIRIVDLAGAVRARLDVQREDRIRYVSRLQWWRPDLLISDSNVGPNGGYIDIWRVSANGGGVSHLKRIMAIGALCELSRDLSRVACVLGGEDRVILRLYDTGKKEFADDDFFRDPDPLDVSLDFAQGRPLRDLEFAADGRSILVDTSVELVEVGLGAEDLGDVSQLAGRPEVEERAVIPDTVALDAGGRVEMQVLARYCPG